MRYLLFTLNEKEYFLGLLSGMVSVHDNFSLNATCVFIDWQLKARLHLIVLKLNFFFCQSTIVSSQIFFILNCICVRSTENVTKYFLYKA